MSKGYKKNKGAKPPFYLGFIPRNKSNTIGCFRIQSIGGLDLNGLGFAAIPTIVVETAVYNTFNPADRIFGTTYPSWHFFHLLHKNNLN
jgi:hypothetical protein